jgi:phosphoglycerol transferase MdoB-like AlkP superfamily enzyme
VPSGIIPVSLSVPPPRTRQFAFARPFFAYLACGWLLLTGMRLLLLGSFREMLGSAAEWPLLFLTGLRFDVLLMCYLMAPLWLLVCFAPPAAESFVKSTLRTYFTVLLAVMAVLEVASWPAIREYGSRPEALFIEFLGHPREVAGMLLTGFWLETITGTVAVGLAAWWSRGVLRRATAAPWPSWWRRLAFFPLGGALLFLGARSSLQHRPANLSTAVFSQNRFHNEAALNSTYTLLYSIYRMKHETESERDYGRMEPAKILEIVRKSSGASDEGSWSGGSTLHRQSPLDVREGRPPNVVVILLESFGAEYTGRLAGTALTPHFDRLAEQGLAFDRLFATGTRTSRGIEAVLSGFFPTPARSVVKLGLSQKDFFTAPELFRRAGYSTHFIYGGAANFDEMKSFFVGNGVQHIWDQEVLEKPEHEVGVWGIHDENLFSEAEQILRAQQDRPFFALVLSTSNHTPFDYPAGRITADPAYPVDSTENAIKYTDHALGQFFERARSSPYFANTLFLIVADHGTRVSGDQLIPVYKFHIPAVILGPPEWVTPGSIQMLASQVDLMPTLLALTGREWDHPMMGRNLLALPEAERADPARGRALLQYETHFGYWCDEQMVILRPDLPAAQFRVESTGRSGAAGFALQPVTADPAFVDAALAHSLFPSWQYRERLYRLPATAAATVAVNP